MSQPHDAEHEARVRAILVAGSDADASAAAEVEQCPECRTLLEELREDAALLDAAAEVQREELRAAEEVVDAPGEREVEGLLERWASEKPGGGAGPRRWWIVAAVAVAAAVLIALWPGWRSGPENGDEPILIGPPDAPRLLQPLEGVDDFARFRWEYDGEVTSFTLRIYDATDEGGDPVYEETHLTETTWTPDAELRDALPDRILWEVDACDAFEPIATSEPALSWRSP